MVPTTADLYGTRSFRSFGPLNANGIPVFFWSIPSRMRLRCVYEHCWKDFSPFVTCFWVYFHFCPIQIWLWPAGINNQTEPYWPCLMVGGQREWCWGVHSRREQMCDRSIIRNSNIHMQDTLAARVNLSWSHHVNCKGAHPWPNKELCKHVLRRSSSASCCFASSDKFLLNFRCSSFEQTLHAEKSLSRGIVTWWKYSAQTERNKRVEGERHFSSLDLNLTSLRHNSARPLLVKHAGKCK